MGNLAKTTKVTQIIHICWAIRLFGVTMLVVPKRILKWKELICQEYSHFIMNRLIEKWNTMTGIVVPKLVAETSVTIDDDGNSIKTTTYVTKKFLLLQ